MKKQKTHSNKKAKSSTKSQKKSASGKKSPKKMNRWLTVLVIALYLAGLGAIAYPFVSNGLYKLAQKQAIRQYEETVVKKDQEQQDKIRQDMEDYNQRLIEEAKATPKDYSVEAEKNLQSAGDRHKKAALGDVIGIVEIPKIKIELPIYNGTNEEQISRGAGLMQGTSMPYGGESTHSVLTSHRGLPAAKLFTDLPELVLGDMFFVKVGSEIHAYEVDQIRVIEPTDFSALGVVEGRDYVTLLTCTPYMINSHRLLVRGYRVEPFDQNDYTKEKAKGRWHTLKKLLLYATIILAILLFFYLFKRWREKRTPFKKSGKRQEKKGKKTVRRKVRSRRKKDARQ